MGAEQGTPKSPEKRGLGRTTPLFSGVGGLSLFIPVGKKTFFSALLLQALLKLCGVRSAKIASSGVKLAKE